MIRMICAALTALTLSLTAAHAQTDETMIPDMVLGSDDAPVTVIEYASLTCPHCATFHAGPYKELKKEYIDTGKVKFIFREVYFDRFGLWGSMIARCAGPDRFHGIIELMMAGQSTWSRAGEPTAIIAELRKIGRLAGMGEEELSSCLEDGDKAQALVSWYQKNADADDITSTPTLMINGTQHSNMNYADLKAIVEKELAK